MKDPRKSKTAGPELRARAKAVKLLVLDVDGVMTDGRIILDNDGNEYKAFHVRDGHGIKMIQRAGIRVALITGRRSKVVDNRASELGIDDVFQKCYDKTAALADLLDKYSLSPDEVAYIGDDIVDVPVLSKVGFPIAVADADKEVMRYAVMVSQKKGGRGAVREVTDFILKAKGLWEELFNEYLAI